MDAIKTVVSEYGIAGVAILSALSLLAWLARVALKNPLEVVSGALKDVELARKALHEELTHKDTRIADLTEQIIRMGKTIESLREKVAELEAELDQYRAEHSA